MLRLWLVVTLALLVRAFAFGVLGAGPRQRGSIASFTVDLNHAPLAELQALPGIGPNRAAAIILHRVRFGPFRRAEDLDAVDGFAPATVARLRPFVRF